MLIRAMIPATDILLPVYATAMATVTPKAVRVTAHTTINHH